MAEFKLKAIAIDDEQHCLDTLNFELERYCPEVELVDQIKDADDALKILKDTDIDLLFLDINLQSTSGITLLESLMPVDFDVIFVTAYDEYALKAFDLSAAHYLLKPINGQKLKTAVEKVFKSRQNKLNQKDINAMVAALKNEINKSDKIALPMSEGIEFVDPNDIIYIEGDSNYATIYLEDESKLLLSKTLKHLEDNILPDYFLRVHKSYIVNINKLSKYVKSDGGYLLLSNNKQIPVSRQKKHLLNNIYN